MSVHTHFFFSFFVSDLVYIALCVVKPSENISAVMLRHTEHAWWCLPLSQSLNAAHQVSLRSLMRHIKPACKNPGVINDLFFNLERRTRKLLQTFHWSISNIGFCHFCRFFVFLRRRQTHKLALTSAMLFP